MEELVLGIDDAGRGPVIGSIVLGGALIRTSDEERLKAMGVKDSKLILAKKREILEEEIKKIALTTECTIFTAKEINEMMNSGINLNFIEAIGVAQIVNKVRQKYPQEKIKVVLDCPSTNKIAWLGKVKDLIGGDMGQLTFICEHRADKDYVAVSAGSIIAKVCRDSEIEKLKKEIGQDFGSGYPSDPQTAKFVREQYHNYKGREIFREHWQTLKKILGIDTKKQSMDEHKAKNGLASDQQKKLF
jgi:ribonuclease HII